MVKAGVHVSVGIFCLEKTFIQLFICLLFSYMRFIFNRNTYIYIYIYICMYILFYILFVYFISYTNSAV